MLITMTQQALERRLDRVDQALQQMLILFQELLSRQAQASVSARETAPAQKVPVPQLASLQQTRPATAPTRTAQASRQQRKKTTKAKGQKLPHTYVPLRTFAQEHQVSPKAIEFASKAGKIPVERGQWRYNNRLYAEALSPQGQQEFYKRFRAREGFVACEHCPHELPASS